MTRLTCVTLLLLTIPVLVGCSGGYEVGTGFEGSGDSSAGQAAEPGGELPAPSGPASPGPQAKDARDAESRARPPEPAPESRPPESSRPSPGPASARSERPAPSAPSSSSAAAQPSIALFPNVALAQTLPTGTAMGFSVDYEFTRGWPNPSSQYAWVVVPAKGRPAKMPVQLGRRGKLEGFFPGVRPEHAPFKTHIEDSQGNRLSASVPVKYP